MFCLAPFHSFFSINDFFWIKTTFSSSMQRVHPHKCQKQWIKNLLILKMKFIENYLQKLFNICYIDGQRPRWQFIIKSCWIYFKLFYLSRLVHVRCEKYRFPKPSLYQTVCFLLLLLRCSVFVQGIIYF